MNDSPFDLVTPEEVRRMATRAIAGVNAYFSPVGDHHDPEARQRDRDRLDAYAAALRFCAAAAGCMGDVSLLDVVVRGLLVWPHFDRIENDDVHGMAEGLAMLLRSGAPVTEPVARVAGHKDSRLRYHMAQGLQPTGPEAIALLEKLSVDPIADVRQAARKTLAATRDIPWWTGKFSSDPLARLSPEEQARHKGALERLSAILDGSSDEIAAHRGDLLERAAELPDALAVDLAEHLLVKLDGGGHKDSGLAALMLSRAGGIEALTRLVLRWGDDSSSRFFGVPMVKEAVAALPVPRRAEVCKALMRFALAATPEERYNLFGSAKVAADIAGASWPPGEDVVPVLDAVLALPPPPSGKSDHVAHHLADALNGPGVDPAPLLQRAIEARLAGYPGRLQVVSGALNALLERAPAEVLRPVAADALRSEDESTARWGLTQLLGPAHDSSTDPPKHELCARFLSDPKCRALVLSTSEVHGSALPSLRAELRGGGLPFKEAAAVMQIIGGLYGGLAEQFTCTYGADQVDSARRDVARSREEARAKLDPAVRGLPGVEGPPTEAEWRALRQARDVALDAEKLPVEALNVLPEGPWHRDDRKIVELTMEAIRKKARGGFIYFLTLVLAAKPDAAYLPLFDELLELTPADAPWGGLIRSCKLIAERDVGPAAGQAAPAAARDWMDEPD